MLEDLNSPQARRLGLDVESLGPKDLVQSQVALAPQAPPATVPKPNMMVPSSPQPAPVQAHAQAVSQSPEDRLTSYLTTAVPGLTPEMMEFGKNYYRSQQALAGLKSLKKKQRAALAKYYSDMGRSEKLRRNLQAKLMQFKEFENAYVQGQDDQGKKIYNPQGMAMMKDLSLLKHKARLAEDEKDNDFRQLKQMGMDLDDDMDPMTVRLMMARGLGMEDDDVLDVGDPNDE